MTRPFVKMSREIALEFISYMIQPDNPPLGIPFGWSQPKEDNIITLGSVYLDTEVNKSLKDLIYGELREKYTYNWTWEWQRDNHDFTFPSNMGSDYLRAAIREFNGSNQVQTINALWECPEIHIAYTDLEREEKLLYHLAIMALNTMTDAHNWAVSYLEYLAYNHYKPSLHSKNWTVYSCDMNEGIVNAIADLIPYCENIADELELNGASIDNQQNGECYHYFNKWNDENTELREWIKDVLDLELEDTRLKSFLDHWEVRSYDGEIIGTLAAMLQWIMDEWNEGNLQFILSDSMPKDLYNWYKMVSSQMILPGMDDTTQ